MYYDLTPSVLRGSRTSGRWNHSTPRWPRRSSHAHCHFQGTSRTTANADYVWSAQGREGRIRTPWRGSRCSSCGSSGTTSGRSPQVNLTVAIGAFVNLRTRTRERSSGFGVILAFGKPTVPAVFGKRSATWGEKDPNMSSGFVWFHPYKHQRGNLARAWPYFKRCSADNLHLSSLCPNPCFDSFRSVTTNRRTCRNQSQKPSLAMPEPLAARVVTTGPPLRLATGIDGAGLARVK